MNKICRLIAVALAFGRVGSVLAETKHICAIVPKQLSNPFFEAARDGCIAAAKELPRTECLFVGPPKQDEAAQVQILADLLNQNVSGIAIAPANAKAVGRALRKVSDARIPIITFDADLLPNDRALRIAYVGSDNYQMGVLLAKELLLLGDTGEYALQSGTIAAENLQERIAGVRDTLKGSGWKEAAGTPVYCNDDLGTANKQIEELLLAQPDLKAIVAVGGWATIGSVAYRRVTEKFASKLHERKFFFISTDSLPQQIELLNEGLVNALVGQSPFDMGYKALMTLDKLSRGEKVPEVIPTEIKSIHSTKQ